MFSRHPVAHVCAAVAFFVSVHTVTAQGSHALDKPNDDRDQIIPTFHVESALTLVDVIAEQSENKLHSRQLLTNLKQGDFRLFDNGHEVQIKNFDVGGQETTIRPIALWLVMLCHEEQPPQQTSGFMQDKMKLLKPALRALQPDDVIGVAHWCDDGATKIDYPPSKNGDEALQAAEVVLHQPAIRGVSRMGELALQKLFSDVIDATATGITKRLPVFLFLYGDHSATYASEADNIIEKLLESSGIVFGMLEQDAAPDLSVDIGAAGQVSYLIHRYASETGGQYYTLSRPDLFPSALAYMLTQVHLRYVLSFKPANLDGKRHELRVELTKAANRLYASPELRFRTEYVPMAPAR